MHADDHVNKDDVLERMKLPRLNGCTNDCETKLMVSPGAATGQLLGVMQTKHKETNMNGQSWNVPNRY